MLKIREKTNLFLLDTHVWIWLVNGDAKLKSSKVLHLIQEAVSFPEILISVISIWEVAMLEVKGRIILPYSCLEWVQRALKAPGMVLMPLTPEIAIESTRLPGLNHADPADRILIATAKDQNATLITCDQNILEYSKKNHFKTISV